MSEFKVKRCLPITDEIRVPGDRDISHRAVILAAISNGLCEVDGFLPSADCMVTVSALRALGVRITEEESQAGCPLKLRVHGRSGALKPPAGGAIDCGASETTLRLLSGILVGQAEGFRVELKGDQTLMAKPMRRLVEPLARMGARIRAAGPGETPPVIIEGSRLRGADCALPVANADLKGAVLLAALFADGKTSVAEPGPGRDHVERLLEFFQVRSVRRGNGTFLAGGQPLESRDFLVPGDLSSAAYWVVAAAAMPGAHLCIRGVGLNETRTGFLKVLVRMGAQITEVVDEMEYREPIGRIEVHGGRLRGTTLMGDDAGCVIEDLPAIAVAASLAEGKTVIRNAKELRVMDSDRIASLSANLRAMGVSVDEFFDGMQIEGGRGLRGARIDSFDDSRIAMAFAIAGLFAEGDTVIEKAECVDTTYPGFYDQLRKFMSEKRTGNRYIPVIHSLNPPSGSDQRRQKKPSR